MQKKQGLQINDLNRHCVDGWLAYCGKRFSGTDAISGRVRKSGRAVALLSGTHRQAL